MSPVRGGCVSPAVLICWYVPYDIYTNNYLHLVHDLVVNVLALIAYGFF
jgi:hypothetical protein